MLPSNERAAIFFVSADFPASRFIREKEIPALPEAAEKEGVKIFQVILSPCMHDRVENLRCYQTVNNPKTPVTGLEKNSQEEVFTHLTEIGNGAV